MRKVEFKKTRDWWGEYTSAWKDNHFVQPEDIDLVLGHLEKENQKPEPEKEVVTLKDIYGIDPDFTGGLPVDEFLKKLRAGELDIREKKPKLG